MHSPLATSLQSLDRAESLLASWLDRLEQVTDPTPRAFQSLSVASRVMARLAAIRKTLMSVKMNSWPGAAASGRDARAARVLDDEIRAIIEQTRAQLAQIRQQWDSAAVARDNSGFNLDLASDSPDACNDHYNDNPNDNSCVNANRASVGHAGDNANANHNGDGNSIINSSDISAPPNLSAHPRAAGPAAAPSLPSMNVSIPEPALPNLAPRLSMLALPSIRAIRAVPLIPALRLHPPVKSRAARDGVAPRAAADAGIEKPRYFRPLAHLRGWRTADANFFSTLAREFLQLELIINRHVERMDGRERRHHFERQNSTAGRSSAPAPPQVPADAAHQLPPSPISVPQHRSHAPLTPGPGVRHPIPARPHPPPPP